MTDTGYYVGWGTLSLINAGPRARTAVALNWVLISLLLGPVATFLIVFLNPARES